MRILPGHVKEIRHNVVVIAAIDFAQAHANSHFTGCIFRHALAINKYSHIETRQVFFIITCN